MKEITVPFGFIKEISRPPVNFRKRNGDNGKKRVMEQ